MSNSVKPHRRQPTRLPHPWDSPGKNTGVGCHFLLQWMKVKSESEVAQSCLTPSYPMDCSTPGPFVHRIFQARVLEWCAIALINHCSIPLSEFLHLFSIFHSCKYHPAFYYYCFKLLCFNIIKFYSILKRQYKYLRT